MYFSNSRLASSGASGSKKLISSGSAPLDVGESWSTMSCLSRAVDGRGLDAGGRSQNGLHVAAAVRRGLSAAADRVVAAGSKHLRDRSTAAGRSSATPRTRAWTTRSPISSSGSTGSADWPERRPGRRRPLRAACTTPPARREAIPPPGAAVIGLVAELSRQLRAQPRSASRAMFVGPVEDLGVGVGHQRDRP